MADYSILRDPDMKEIFDSFVVETVEILDKLDLDLVELERRPDDTDLLNDIFRSFHTIKGTSGFLGLERLQKVTHLGEDLLNKLRKGEAKLNDQIMDAILVSYDTIKALLSVIESQLNEEYDIDPATIKLQFVIDIVEGKTGGETAEHEETSQEDVFVPEPTPTPELTNVVTEESDHEPEVEHDDEPDEEPEVIPIPVAPTGPTIQSKAETAPAAEVAAVGGASKKGDNSIRVDVERLNELLNLVQELVLGRNRLTQITNEASLNYEGTKLSRDLSETSRHIDLMTTELQLAVMKTRMIKIGKVFNKFPRLVRDLSKATKKDIELEIFGEDTELDKTLIEEINDPLVHLIRNSVDHGVETPEERMKKGKKPTGTITLAAEHEGNNIIITIEDDGKGIDTEIIKSKAVSKGLISEEKARELTKQEAFNLIFLPGFSTAAKVTNISGRGVGMDVVKTNVTKLRGIINVESEVNVRTKIIIKLPLTLAIIQGLLVNIIGETVVVPLSSVIEVVRISKKQIYSVNKKQVIKLRDIVLPLVDIDRLLYKYSNNQENKESQYVVVVGVAEKKFGIKVDELIGQREIVIKSLGEYLGTIHGIAGSTIMGDGKVVMILDLAEIVNSVL